jgi:hypothetical protein
MDSTQSSLLIMGCVSLIAAIVGGNLKLPSTEFGKLESPLLRAALGSLGIGLIVTSFFLPTLTRNRPLKGEYLARLDTRCARLTTAATMPELSAHLSLWRQFSDEWHKWPTPQGDDETVAEIQKKFLHTIDQIELIEPLYDRALLHREEDLTQPNPLGPFAIPTGPFDKKTLGELAEQLTSTSKEYIEEMRSYGSTPCSDLVAPVSVVAGAIKTGIQGYLMDIIKQINP